MKMKKMLFLALFALLSLPLLLRAKPPIPIFRFRTYQVTDGLSENTVYCISQDAKGFMWFGTKDGLNRFDGREYKTYRKGRGGVSAPGNNFIRCMAPHGLDSLWVGTDMGVYVMDTAEEVFSGFDKVAGDGVRMDCGINAICFGRNRCVWFATQRGIFRYDRSSNSLEHFSGEVLPSEIVWSIYEDKAGSIWAGTREGVVKYDELTRSFVRQGRNPSPNVGDEEAFAITEDKDGQLWFGTWSGGLKTLDRAKNTFITYYGRGSDLFISHIRTIVEFSDRELLVGSDDGLYLFNKSSGDITRMDRPGLSYSLGDQNVYSIFRDREGGLWVGTYFGGVSYLFSENNAFEHYSRDFRSNSLSGNAVRQFCEDESGNLWIATEDGGLSYFDIASRTFERRWPASTVSYHNVHSLLIAGDEMWVGTFSRGIDVFDRRTGQVRHYRHNEQVPATVADDCIFSLARSSDGRIWIGTPVGLDVYDPAADAFRRVPEAACFVYDIREDSYGNLWIASYGSGALCWRRSENRWYHYLHSGEDSSLGFNKLVSIHIDGRQQLWFTSEGGGIMRYNYQTDDFTTFDEDDGLPNNVTYAMQDDAYGNLWISSNKGLTCFDPETRRVLAHYTGSDGLQSNEFNYKAGYKAKDGMMYFGGIRGFTAFYPDQLVRNECVPPVEFTSFLLLNRGRQDLQTRIDHDLNRTREVVLPHGYASFTVSFVSLSYQAGEKNEYAYMMEGMDTGWNRVGNRDRITYVDLPPGSYSFRVKASNNHGVWNEQGNSLSITVRPPWWGTLMAKISYLLLALLAVYWVGRYYIVRTQKRNWERMRRYKALQEQRSLTSKISFFTSVAHEIRTPLSLIQAPLEEILRSGKWNARSGENLRTIERNTQRLGELVNQLLDFRKLESDKYHLHYERVRLREYLNEILSDFRRTAQVRGVGVTLEIAPDFDPEIVSDHDALSKVVVNLMSNALKFTRDRIVVRVEGLDGDRFRITVADNGCGIPEKFRDKVFEPFFQINGGDEGRQGTGIGLSLARLMARSLGGDLAVRENPGGGALFEFTFQAMEEALLPTANLAAKTAPAVPVEPQVPSVDRIPSPTAAQRHTVLFVDDNEELCSFIEGNLKEHYNIITASDGRRALDVMADNIVDLVVSDIMMPGIDGINLVRQMKQSRTCCHIPIILLSAKSAVDSKVEGLEQGAEAFVEKPFSPAYLKAQIDTLLANRVKMFGLFSKAPVSMYEALVPNRRDVDFISKLNEHIEQHLSDVGFSVESMSDLFSMSRSNLQRKLNGVCGMSPNDYLRTYRLKKAAELLAGRQYRISEVCYLVGFSSPSYFSKCFMKQFGVLPKDFLDGAGSGNKEA